ncbi:conserved hypothetical protein [gamma proteobacterium HdN1]|nr:conserved hypothetical protein [gamma proteobacterium HdN1]
MFPKILIAFGLMFLMSTNAEALNGREIIDKAHENTSGFQDMSHQVRMILVDEKGNKSEREMLLKARVNDKGDSSSLSIFTSPQREKGIALLTNHKVGEGDEQWIYLPSTRRMKRVTSASRSSSFRGSEFTFEDLSSQNPEDYRFERAADEACGELQCYVVDRYPSANLESSYSKTRLWIDTTHYRPFKAEYFDKDGKPLKTMQAFDYRQYDHRFWNPARVVMKNLQTGKATELVSMDLKINAGLKESEFTELAIRSWH